MKLKDSITLSKKHKKAFDIFPFFFIPSLNTLYKLNTEKGFTKPKLSTWRDEALIEFTKKENRVLIQYLWLNFVEIRIGKKGQPKNQDFMLSKTFKTVNEKSASDIHQPLNKYLQSVLVDIYEELNKLEIT